MIFKKTESKKEETININSLPFRTILDEKQKKLSKTAYIVKETIPVVELKFVFHMDDPGHPSFLCHQIARRTRQGTLGAIHS